MVSAMSKKPLMASNKPLLSVRDLRKSYGDHQILKGVSFDLMAGETLVLIGPSGSGKTTVLRCLNHLETPSGGEITLAGDTIGGSYVGEAARWEPMSETKLALQRRKFGFVFQRFNLLPTMTAKGNIAIAQFIHGDGFDPHRFDVVTKMLGLDGRLQHKPSEMSGGEQQRVAIARAIINEPKILLADEPTGNLDTKNSDIVLEMLRRLNKDLGQTIVMITHNPEATAYFDRVVHMRDGVIVDGVPAD